ncbi:MAG: hypothetical protein CM15mP120_29390 [Pseudomonadota bacterium]|nr:MAG: hypothetical protein CM15mP120_29390 [Pseudomonadota bacterium]
MRPKVPDFCWRVARTAALLWSRDTYCFGRASTLPKSAAFAAPVSTVFSAVPRDYSFHWDIENRMDLYDNDALRWKHYAGSDKFDCPIDYWSALLSARADGHVDLLYRWEPNSYCHFIDFSADTTSLVLEGELHVIDRQILKPVLS